MYRPEKLTLKTEIVTPSVPENMFFEPHVDTAYNGTHSVGGGVPSCGSDKCSIDKTNTLPYTVEDFPYVAVKGMGAVPKNADCPLPPTWQRETHQIPLPNTTIGLLPPRQRPLAPPHHPVPTTISRARTLFSLTVRWGRPTKHWAVLSFTLIRRWLMKIRLIVIRGRSSGPCPRKTLRRRKDRILLGRIVRNGPSSWSTRHLR